MMYQIVVVIGMLNVPTITQSLSNKTTILQSRGRETFKVFCLLPVQDKNTN